MDTLLCWHSVNHGNEVLYNAIKALKNRKIYIEKVILLTQKNKIREPYRLDSINLKLIELNLDDPTEHQTIYRLMLEKVLPVAIQEKKLHINISPGTPAMHAVWLLLHAGGRFVQDTRLWSSQFNHETKRTSIKEVDFPINTYLSEIYREKRKSGNLAFYGTSAKSAKRKRFLSDLKNYAMQDDDVLFIIGESGSGKTRLQHTLKAICQKPLIYFSCKGLSELDMQQQLFGRNGSLFQAENGILFIDDFQQLTDALKEKILTAFDKQAGRVLGDKKDIPVRFQLVCICDTDIKTSGLKLTIPPLRDCREDLADDFQHILMELGTDIPKNQDEAIENFFLSIPFLNNFNDLKKFATLINLDEDRNNAIEQAIKSIQQENESHSNYYLSLKQTREQMLNTVKYKIAVSAKAKYKSWRKAAEALDCDEKTLRNDANINLTMREKESNS